MPRPARSTSRSPSRSSSAWICRDSAGRVMCSARGGAGPRRAARVARVTRPLAAPPGAGGGYSRRAGSGARAPAGASPARASFASRCAM